MKSVDRRRADVHTRLPGPPWPRPVMLSLMWQVGKWGAERAGTSPQGPATGDPTGHGPAGLPADAVLGPSLSQVSLFPSAMSWLLRSSGRGSWLAGPSDYRAHGAPVGVTTVQLPSWSLLSCATLASFLTPLSSSLPLCDAKIQLVSPS